MHKHRHRIGDDAYLGRADDKVLLEVGLDLLDDLATSDQLHVVMVPHVGVAVATHDKSDRSANLPSKHGTLYQAKATALQRLSSVRPTNHVECSYLGLMCCSFSFSLRSAATASMGPTST